MTKNKMSIVLTTVLIIGTVSLSSHAQDNNNNPKGVFSEESMAGIRRSCYSLIARTRKNETQPTKEQIQIMAKVKEDPSATFDDPDDYDYAYNYVEEVDICVGEKIERLSGVNIAADKTTGACAQAHEKFTKAQTEMNKACPRIGGLNSCMRVVARCSNCFGKAEFGANCDVDDGEDGDSEADQYNWTQALSTLGMGHASGMRPPQNFTSLKRSFRECPLDASVDKDEASEDLRDAEKMEREANEELTSLHSDRLEQSASHAEKMTDFQNQIKDVNNAVGTNQLAVKGAQLEEDQSLSNALQKLKSQLLELTDQLNGLSQKIDAIHLELSAKEMEIQGQCHQDAVNALNAFRESEQQKVAASIHSTDMNSQLNNYGMKTADQNYEIIRSLEKYLCSQKGYALQRQAAKNAHRAKIKAVEVEQKSKLAKINHIEMQIHLARERSLQADMQREHAALLAIEKRNQKREEIIANMNLEMSRNQSQKAIHDQREKVARDKLNSVGMLKFERLELVNMRTTAAFKGKNLDADDKAKAMAAVGDTFNAAFNVLSACCTMGSECFSYMSKDQAAVTQASHKNEDNFCRSANRFLNDFYQNALGGADVCEDPAINQNVDGPSNRYISN